jgi:hypothetical protein
MTKTITLRSVSYVYYVATGDLYTVKESGLPAAGAILTAVYGAKKTKILDAILAA